VTRGVVRGVTAFVRRDMAQGSALRVPVVLDLAFGLVNLLAFVFISRAVRGGGSTFAQRGMSYFDFAAVGIAFMLVVQAAVTQATMRIGEEQRSGTIEQVVSSPAPVAAIAFGLGAYQVLFAMVRTGVYLLLAGVLLGLNLGSTDWIGVLVVLVLGGVATAAIGVCLAALALAMTFGTSGSRLVMVGLAFFSGTYFPVDTLPGWARGVGWPLPTRFALDGLRSAVAGSSWVGSAAALAVAVVVLVPLSVMVFSAALRFAALRGTLVRG
jgi:ABC-2 type transport system permease protein